MWRWQFWTVIISKTERTPETVGALMVRSLYAVCKKRDV